MSDPPSGGLTAIKKYLFLPLLLGYCLLLLLASWPKSLQPEFLQKPHETARLFFRTLRIRASSAVFHGNGGDSKRKNQAVFVIGELSDGVQTTLYSSYEGLYPASLRILNDTFDTTLKRMLGMKYTHRLTDPEQELDMVYRARHDDRFSLVSNFYCLSQLIDNNALQKVFIVWYFEKISYQTGKISSLLEVMHGFDCQKRRPIFTTWPEVYWDQEQKKMIVSH